MCLYKTIVYYLELLLYHIKLAIDENLNPNANVWGLCYGTKCRSCLLYINVREYRRDNEKGQSRETGNIG